MAVGEETATVVEPAAHAARTDTTRTPTPLPTPLTDALPSPEIALQRVEIEQTLRTAITGVLFSLLGLASALFVVGDPLARELFAISLVVAIANNLWLWYAASSERRYTQNKLLVYFGIAPFLNAGIIYHLGVFGPILVMFILNIYTACLNYSRRVAFFVLVGSILPFAALAVPITFGWLTDPGLLSATSRLDTLGLTFVDIAYTAFLVVVYVQARSARELMVSSLRERDEAVRRASHREALFVEARQELERALRAGGLGRFTDQTLGSFKLGAVLGRGGMGEVYEATHVTTGQAAAVKMLLPEVLALPNYVRRFLREVKIAAALDSPHVVRVLEVGDESAALPYLAMERLHGEDLAQLLRRDEKLAPARVVELVRQVGRGLAVATAAGIVHRDVKPQNLFLSQGTWKILDFGVSKLLESDAGLTDNEAVGTPQYMAPEQARGGTIDARADLYAVGAIAYRALTGHPPFNGENTEVLLAVISTMPVRPSSLAELPRDVDAVLAIAMAKSAADRYGSAEQLANDLEAALEGRLDHATRARSARLTAALPWREPRRRSTTGAA